MPELLQVEEIDNVSFSTSRRGYATEEVDAFLLKVRQTLGYLQDRADNAYRRLGEEMGGLLQEAKDHAEEMRSAGEQEAARLRQEAGASAKRTREEAEKQAAALRKSAEDEASARIDEAEKRVRQLQQAEEEVRRRLEQLRVDLQSVVGELQALDTVDAQSAGPQPGDVSPDAPAAAAVRQTIRFEADSGDVKP